MTDIETTNLFIVARNSAPNRQPRTASTWHLHARGETIRVTVIPDTTSGSYIAFKCVA